MRVELSQKNVKQHVKKSSNHYDPQKLIHGNLKVLYVPTPRTEPRHKMQMRATTTRVNFLRNNQEYKPEMGEEGMQWCRE